MHDGVAAEIATSHKERKYLGCVFFAFPVEDLGRFGNKAAALIRMLAPQCPTERSHAISMLYQDVSCIPQRCNADAIIAAMG